MLLVILSGVVVVAVVLELGTVRLLRSQNLLVGDGFSDIDEELLEKFSSFDAELGWEPQPNTTKKKDTNHDSPDAPDADAVTYSTDRYGSRICPVSREEGQRVATYGDSFCFCREVNDDETVQHHLATKLGKHVSNYGAGNYGLDQALLRLRRRFDADPADYVVMAVTPDTLPRMLSVWRHYHQFGNVLAVNPRFVHEDGELTLIDSPLERKEDLLDLQTFEPSLRAHDYHYEHWYRDFRPSRPYMAELVRDPRRLRFLAWATVARMERETGIALPYVASAQRRNAARPSANHFEHRYYRNIYTEFSDLYCDVFGEFVDFVRARDATPIFLPLQQLHYQEYARQHGEPLDAPAINRIRREYPEVHVCDVRERLPDRVESVEDLYIPSGEHYNSRGNELIADELATLIEGT
jgi:hypothetical protein